MKKKDSRLQTLIDIKYQIDPEAMIHIKGGDADSETFDR